MKAFEQYPLIVRGESKELRKVDDNLCLIKFIPSVYSYTYNRNGIVEGTEKIRVTTSMYFANLLNAIKPKWHYYIEQVSEDTILSYYSPSMHINETIKNDMESHSNFEIIAKGFHLGTPVHRYRNMDQWNQQKIDRMPNEPFVKGEEYIDSPQIRFDWRNPNKTEEGERLCDEPVHEDLARHFFNIDNTKNNAVEVFNLLQTHMRVKHLLLKDICFFFTDSGNHLFGEVSPDCMRVESLIEGESNLDKDVWRAGGSSDLLLTKWQLFEQMLLK